MAIDYSLANYQPVDLLAKYQQGADMARANQMGQLQTMQQVQALQKQNALANILKQSGGDAGKFYAQAATVDPAYIGPAQEYINQQRAQQKDAIRQANIEFATHPEGATEQTIVSVRNRLKSAGLNDQDILQYLNNFSSAPNPQGVRAIATSMLPVQDQKALFEISPADKALKQQLTRAQIADYQAQAQQRISGKAATIPAGYRQTAEGNLEAIPGGPADLKLQGQFNQDTAALQNSLSSFDRLGAAANELLNHPGLAGITGSRGALPNFPGSAAADAEAKLATLKSQVGFGVLQDMRNNSKTGGALGAVSDAEGKRLEANLAALDKAQSIDQFKQSLQKIIDYSDQAKGRMANAYNMRASQRPNIQQPTMQVTPHPQDTVAVQWAKANPGDPRAARILQLTGGQ